MSAVLPAVLLTLCISVCADARVRQLAVFSSPALSADSVLNTTIQDELQQLLTPAGIDVVWRLAGKSDPREQFEVVVVGSFAGLCSVAELPAAAISARTSVLGETYVSSNGRVLPYFKVDCARLIQTLRPTLERLSLPLRRVVFGRAVARVVAHEIYHILAQALAHDDLGVAKPSFSIEDLTAERFHFDFASLERMQSVARPAAVAQTFGFLPLDN